MESQKNIIAFVMKVPRGAIETIRSEKSGLGPVRFLLLHDSRIKDKEGVLNTPGVDITVQCDFSKPNKIAEALLPYQSQLLAITCRSEKNIARFAQVLPHVPYLRTPTTESLRWAADKYEMRKRLKMYNPKLTPKFTLVKGNTKKERARVSDKIGYPVVIKPTNLAASLFVTVCYHEEELERALGKVFRKMRQAYINDNRLEEPKVIAEQYMEGQMYSIDSYVNSRGVVYHCPLVKQKTAKEIGREDFYNYLQMTPTALKSATVERAEAAATDAVRALGLRSTITHTELMKIDDEWKIVEIGARGGGFRPLLHKLSCDIEHHINDILIRIPKKPVIPKKCKGFACAMKWFAAKEGVISELKGIKKIEELESFHQIDVNKKVGDRAVFARNGGRSVFNLFLYNDDRSKLLADIRRVENIVEVKVAGRKVPVSKKAVKSTVLKKKLKKKEKAAV